MRMTCGGWWRACDLRQGLLTADDQPLAVIPKLDSQRPDPEFLRWHLTECSVG